MLEQLLTVVQKFGFPVALCVVLLLAIRHQNAQLVKAYTDRISLLEDLIRSQGEKIEKLQKESVERSIEYANSLKDIAGRYASSTREVFGCIREILPVLRRLVDSINTRPCMHDYHPTVAPSRPPSSDDLPPPPRNHETTDRIQSHG